MSTSPKYDALSRARAEKIDPDGAFSLPVAERIAIVKALRAAKGNKRFAASLLRIGKTTLYRKIEEHRIRSGEWDPNESR